MINKITVVLSGLLTVLFLTSISFGESKIEKRNDWEKYKIKGKVKERRIYQYCYFDDFKTEEFFYKKFDKYGYLVEEMERYYEDTTAYENKYYYKYDDKNNLIEERLLDSKFGTEEKKVYEYDEKGLCVERQEFNPKGERQYRFVKKYDENGNEIEELYYNWSDTLSNITYRKYDVKGNLLDDGRGTIYKYDDKENVIEICDFGYEGDLLKKINYEYDNKGILIKDCCFDALNETYDSTKITYNDKGQKIESVVSIYGADGNWLYTNRLKFKYDKKGRLVTKRYSFSRSDPSYTWKYYKETFRYDRSGNIVKHRSYTVDDKTIVNGNEIELFKYDDIGNLIEYKKKYGKYIKYLIYEAHYEYMYYDE